MWLRVQRKRNRPNNDQTKAFSLLFVVLDSVHDAPIHILPIPSPLPCTISLPIGRLFRPKTHRSSPKPARKDRQANQRQDRPSRTKWLLRFKSPQQAACRGLGGQWKGAQSSLSTHVLNSLNLVLVTFNTQPSNLVQCWSSDLHQGREKLQRHLHQRRAPQQRGRRVGSIRA